MPLPVIPNVFRVALLWDPFAGMNPRNVFHVLAPPLASEAQVASQVDAALTDAMFAPVHTAQLLTRLGVTALDGTSAEIIFPVTGPRHGSSVQQISPASAALVSLRTLRRGPRGRGRQYIGALGEDFMSGGRLVEPVPGALAAAWNTFDATLGTGLPSLKLVIASYKHADYNLVNSISTDTLLATQRRRQDQLRP